jgi:hypothetical protein
MRGVALALIAAAVLVVAARYGSFVAGGSDSYCYVSQAERWAAVIAHPIDERLQVVNPLALAAPWPNAALSFAPAGYIPSPTVAGAVVPMCPAGLSIVMAIARLGAGPAAVFAVVPLFGMVLVLATAAVGGRYGARIGLAAALIVACSPVFLYQIVQPMSDVPAAALWMVALACATGTKPRDPGLAGAATSAAILMRPNLVPLGFAIGLFLLLRPERSWRQRVRAAAIYAAWSAAGCVAVGLIQYAFYGSPLSSGYGSLDNLFGIDHVTANAGRYATWLWQTETPFIILAILAPVLLPGALSALYLSLVAINIALYLPYTVFDDWSFLRFLLPTVPIAIVLALAVLDAALRRLRITVTTPILAVVAVVLAIVLVGEARDRDAFRLKAMESRFARAGEYVARRLPANAVVLTVWQSGSVRYYAGRNTIVWDALPPDGLDRAFEFLRARQLKPYLLFERDEDATFRQRFADSPTGAVDWPPMADIGRVVRVFDPADRPRYLAGANITTEYTR